MGGVPQCGTISTGAIVRRLTERLDTMVDAVLILKIIRACRLNLPYVLMVVLIGEGVLAAVCMFIMPPISLLMVFVGIGTLGVAAVARIVLERSEGLLAKWLGVPPMVSPE